MTHPAKRNIIPSIRGSRPPGGRHQIGTPAGFKSESVAGFLLECVAGFVGIRTETQMLMTRQLSNPFPPYLLVVVVCWASALFLGNGLVATPNAVSVVAHLAGATAIGSAIFLILELSQPYSGVVRLSSTGVDRLLQVLGQADTKNIA